MKRVRCAIYTRKSSEEGLEQTFNSLDAQRVACSAYILSQASEGWTETREVYDDGGISGGTLDRPALQRLLADVSSGRIDIIVVYKVDRLTRSLLDFAKLVEAFDKAETSFVSITQSFNTTTSMGRLTLNMLLSFAQFEREVTAERIRDKIAASKARGMWMGGVPPLGYAPDGRTLRIVEEQAAVVRQIFERYLALGSVRLLQSELRQQGVRVPVRATLSGKQLGGGVFTRGQLYHLLKNIIYTGQIGHRDHIYLGQHSAILDKEKFDQTQALLASHVQGSRSRVRAGETSPLAGKIIGPDGEALLTTHATKGNARYRYYVSRDRHHGRVKSGVRIPAREIESLVAGRLAELFADPLAFAGSDWMDVPAHRLGDLHDRCHVLQGEMRQRQPPALASLVTQVQVGNDGVEILCSTVALGEALGARLRANAPATLTLATSAQITRSGHAIRLVHDDGSAGRQPRDRSLVRLIVQARRWWTMLKTEPIGVTELAKREGVTRSYLCRIVRLAFLSPAVTQAILAGVQRADVNVAALMPEDAIPISWAEQHHKLLPATALA